MRRRMRCAATAAGAVWVACGSLAGTGCRHQAKYDTSVTHVEEFHAAPSEDRFNNPPEVGYRKPPAKKEFKPSFGGGSGGGPGMGGAPGMGQ